MKLLEQFATDGWIQVEGVFDRKLIDELHADYLEQSEALLEIHDDERRDFLRVGEGRAMLSVALRGPFLDPRLYANPILLKLLGLFLDANFLIDSFTCVTSLPGAAEQPRHRDHGQLFPGKPGAEQALGCFAATVVVPLVDLGADTGTTRLFSGSHLGSGDSRPAEPMIPRGSCFVMDYRLLHQGMANVSGDQRPVLFIVYARPWFSDSKNFHRQARINLNAVDLKTIPIEHRPLFRRLAGKGTLPLSERELLSGS